MKYGSRWLYAAAVLAFAVPQLQAAGSVEYVGQDFRERPCAGNPRGQGPYDYRQREKYGRKFSRVVGAHFKPWVRDLQANKARTKGTSPYNDIDYTLRAVPNHHFALYSMMRYAWHPVWGQDIKSRPTPPECYLQRAINFAPDDPHVRLLFGVYLHRNELHEEAEKQYRQALKLNKNIADAHYNFGLLLTDLGRFDEAKKHAAKAYELGYPLPGLRNRLTQAGHTF